MHHQYTTYIKQDAIITIRWYLATCFGRDRPSSGQIRTTIRYSKNITQWDPKYHLIVIIASCLMYVVYWRFHIYYTKYTARRCPVFYEPQHFVTLFTSVIQISRIQLLMFHVVKISHSITFVYASQIPSWSRPFKFDDWNLGTAHTKFWQISRSKINQ